MNYIAFAVAGLAIPSIFFVLDKFLKHNKWVLRSFSLLLGFILFMRVFLVKNSMFNNCLRLVHNSPFSSPFLTFCVVTLVWFTFASTVILILSPFFKYPLLKNLSKTFCLIVSLLNIGFLNQTVFSFVRSDEVSLFSVFFTLEITLSLFLSIYSFFSDKNFKISKPELKELLLMLPIFLLFAIPPYLLNTYFGTTGVGLVIDLKFYHRIYLYLTFVILFGIYFLLRNKDKEYGRMVILYISLVSLISYLYDYDFWSFTNPRNLPLHLCNTAMFIIPICLIFKLEKLFYFTLFINVLGAFFAMAMPNYEDSLGFLDHETVRFWINHIIAFDLPILIVLLKIYQRPKLKLFIYSMIGFFLYFVLVLFLNAWFSNYGTTVDYFFINSDFIADKLGTWAEDTRNITVSWNIGNLTLVFYPLYQSLFFIVYIFLGLGMWFIYTAIFQIQDFYFRLAEKRRKIKLDENALCVKYGQKEVNDCMNKDSLNKLVIKHVSKRYGTNKNYSVKDASFEVEAGEILGFLGPNGAGKSTIIKCIVGIQPPTEGTIEINGYDIERQPVLAKEQFGFVPDHYALYEKLTGREYVNYMADLYGVSQEDRDKRLQKLLKDLNMEANFDNQIRTYSHGMKQKIAIMSALIHNPKLWILDEPLTGLDPNSIYEVKECMKEHAKQGNIVFFSSHIIDIVEKLCDRIIIIKKGRIITTTTLKDLKKKKISLEKFYLDIINSKDSEDMTYNEEKPPVEENLNVFFQKKQKKSIKGAK